MEREELVRHIQPVIGALRAYHRHEVIGLANVPKRGRALIVVNHSLATYDIGLLMHAINEAVGRFPRPLIDRTFFRVPLLGDLTTAFGAVQGSPEAGRQLLDAEEIVTVAPGGMREALRPSSERYQIRWERRLGFCKLAMEKRAPIILAACPKADDLFDVYPSRLTKFMYRQFKLPLPIARGIGPTPLPRPVKLVHFLSEAFMPPEWVDDDRERTRRLQEFHATLVRRMRELISEAIHYRASTAKA